jgi:prophage DNA circulation protein
VDAQGVLLIVLIVSATAACAAAIWALVNAVSTLKSVKALSDDVSERLLPLLEKADVTVDAANAELLRIDSAITRLEDASVRVSAVSGTLTDIVSAPAGIVTGVADRVRRAWKDRHQASSAEATRAQDAGSDGQDE